MTAFFFHSYHFSYYAKNKDARGGVYTDKLIWSPGVLIIKYGDFLENPAPVNFISGAAINRYALSNTTLFFFAYFL